MENRIVELRDVSKSFGKVRALKNVDFHVDDAEVVGLIGDNGAGKSTLIKIVSGVHAPDSGEIYIHGQRLDHWSVAAARGSGGSSARCRSFSEWISNWKTSSPRSTNR